MTLYHGYTELHPWERLPSEQRNRLRELEQRYTISDEERRKAIELLWQMYLDGEFDEYELIPFTPQCRVLRKLEDELMEQRQMERELASGG